MSQWWKKLSLVISVVLVSSQLTAKPWTDPFAGGEIPWPLSVQHMITVKNSRGLWKLEDNLGERMFNVEMSTDGRSGFDWIRVSELDPKSYVVKSWGEGFFSSGSKKGSDSSYSNITLGPSLGQKDPHGRYLTMFPNGDVTKKPFIIRMVEVDTSLGVVLGLSVITGFPQELEHMLGSRVMEDPLSCAKSNKTEKLTCYLDL